MKKIIFLLSSFIFIFPSTSFSIEITASQFGDKWPFTVDKGQLECRAPHAVIFTVNGKTYALNGKAQRKEWGYSNPAEILKNDPKRMEGYRKDPALFTGPPKMLHDAIINKGLELCQ